MAYRSPYQVPHSERYAPSAPEIYVDIEVRELRPDYRAAFATTDLPKGTILARDGGVVVTSLADVPHLYYAVLIDDGLWLAPRDYDNLESICFLNHSCESNVGRTGGLIYFAKKDIRKGEELTLDYASFISGYEGWTLNCGCGSPKCRKVITNHDHENPAVAAALWQEWLPFVQKIILAKKAA